MRGMGKRLGLRGRLTAVVMIAVVAIIVPVFVGIFNQLNAENPDLHAKLPMMTQITVGASNLVTHNSWPV